MQEQSERVPLPVAAAEMGMSPQGLREYMKRGLIDIGTVLPSSSGKGKKHTYLVYRAKLDRYLGKIP